MNVLHVYRTYFPDQPSGIAEAIRQMGLASRPLGIESTVFTLSPRPEPRVESRPEGRIVRCRSWAAPASCDLGTPDCFRTFAGLAGCSDVIHYHGPWPFGDLLHLAARPAAPSVVTWHSDIVRQRMAARLYRPLMRKMLASAAYVVATSEAYARTSPVLSHPAVRERVRVIPLGMGEHGVSCDDHDLILGRMGLARPFFLFLGARRYYKGLDHLVAAAADVRAQVVLAGTGMDATTWSGASGNLVLAGAVTEEEKTSLLRSCRAVVLPSHLRAEAFGMVLVEASMNAKPMVSCEIGTGTSYVNLDRVTGFVVEPGDTPALVRAMNRLLADDALAARMGRAARERYEELFTAERMARSYASLYAEMRATQPALSETRQGSEP
jgi:rhamnosyl/mannosyltransferase